MLETARGLAVDAEPVSILERLLDIPVALRELSQLGEIVV